MAALKLIVDRRQARPATGGAEPGQTRFENALEVARVLRPEQPVLCFSAEALAARVSQFLAGFPGEVSYAVKANGQEAVLSTLAAAGIRVFDVASLGEMETVRRVAPGADFHYHNPVKSRAEIATAFRRFGCRRFAVDDMRELSKIADTLGLVRDLEIAVRFRLPPHGLSAHDFSSKFGATPEEAVALLRHVASFGFKPVLTFHPGSQCRDPEAYARHIETAAAIARQAGVALHALNVGGGFPARYRDREVPPLEAFFAVIEASVRHSFGDASLPTLECEPGRGMVATAMSLLTRVKLVKPARREVFLNDGIYGALLEVTQAPDLLPPTRAIRDGEPLHAEETEFTVYGPTCDPLDRLPVPLSLPRDLAEDDFVEFGTLGAYGAATSTRFNGYEVKDVVPVRTVLAA